MTVKDEIEAKLSAERAGRKLGDGLLTVIVDYLVDVVEVKDVNEVVIKDLLEIATDAWAETKGGGVLPGLHKKNIVARIAGKPIAVHMSSALSNDGGDDLEDDVDDSKLLGVEAPNARDLAKLEQDKQSQGLSGARLLVLSMSLELGRVPATGDVVGVLAYKGDARLTDLAKQQRKAGMPTLSKIVDGTNVRRDLQTHFSNLIRDYSDAGYIVEASRITQWWGETQTVSSDDKVLADYLKEYFRKYPGRGLPEVIDVIIATRVTGQRASGGISNEQLEKVREMAKAAKNEVAELKRELGSLKSELGRLKAKPGGPGSEQVGKGPKCHNCGAFGHIAKNCPDKAKDKDGAKDDGSKDDDE